MATNCEEFVPYDQPYKCANKDCHNTWSVHLTEPLPIMICGDDAKVCPQCEQAGYTICSEEGDGLYYLYRNGEEVAVYDHNTAYNIVHTTEDVGRSFFAELMEGHPPDTDCFPSELLKDYVNELKYLQLVKKYDNDCYVGSGWSNNFNNYCKKHGSNVHLVPLSTDRKDRLYFRYQSESWNGILSMDLDPIDFDFEDFGEELVKEPELC